MFRVKICGITRVEDAQCAAAAGADAIGLNFYPQSKRCVDVDRAQQIAASLPQSVTKVGVFVNTEMDEVRRIAVATGLDAIQLHGDEPPSAIAQLKEWKVIRAFRPRSEGLDQVAAYLASCANRLPTAVLVDAHVAGEFGGTGARADWSALAAPRAWLGDTPLILAGGLTPENVAEAIALVRPSGVDTASGVESSPGVKDPSRVEAFVASALAALGQS